MKERISGRIFHLFILASVMFIAVGGAAVAYPSWREGQLLRDRSAELQTQIEGKKHEIAELVENQRRFRTDPDFVESIARRNRRVFPGELVFLFDD